jgi:hypothetical protein
MGWDVLRNFHCPGAAAAGAGGGGAWVGGQYQLNAVDPELERRLVSTLEPGM